MLYLVLGLLLKCLPVLDLPHVFLLYQFLFFLQTNHLLLKLVDNPENFEFVLRWVSFRIFVACDLRLVRVKLSCGAVAVQESLHILQEVVFVHLHVESLGTNLVVNCLLS